MKPTLLHHDVGRFRLDCGQVLHDLTQAYTLAGELNARRDNVVLLFHSLTGDADPQRWWAGLVGPGRVIDTARYAVLCANLLGSCYGTTRPPAGVRVTTRDMARLTGRLVRDLGVRAVALASGGSLGGMVVLEWAVQEPVPTRSAVAFAAPAAHSAYAIGLNHVQRLAVRLGGTDGLALARMAAMMTYRTAAEFDTRFGRGRRADGIFEMQSYLDHQGAKLVDRFDADAYLTLLDAMDSHDIGRSRDGVSAALRRFGGALFGVGITGDLLYAPDDVRSWTHASGAAYREIRSVHGHDAFLLEAEQASAVVAEALAAGAAYRQELPDRAEAC